MIRNQPDKGGGGGRRPLLITGNNRQMLNEIRDNLSHLRKNDINLANDLSNVQLKQDLSQSTPNLLEKSAAKGRRDKQHHKALAEIRDSLRPYQNATQTNGSYPSTRNSNNNTAVGGSGAGSDNSSTASSSSSHTALDQEVNPLMVQEIIKRGFDKEIAVHALRLSPNQSVEAALRLLQYMMDMIKDGCYPSGPPPQSVLPTYHTRPSFGPRSPSTSESANSIRSDSPGLTQAPPSAPHTRHLLANGLQTPPPLPPRVPITAANAGHNPPTPSSNSTPSALTVGVIDGTAKLSIASSAASTSLIAQQSLSNQSTGPVLSGSHINKGKMGGAQTGLHPHNAVLDQSDIPQGHVKQLIQLISPQPSHQSYYSIQHHQQQQQQHQHKHHQSHHVSPQQPQPQQPPQVNGGPFLGQRGVSPVPSINCQQQQSTMMIGTTNNTNNTSASNTPAPSPLLSQQLHSILSAAGSNSSNSPSPAPSSCGSSSVQHNFPQGPPPPYSQAQAQIQAARLGISIPAATALITTHSEHSGNTMAMSDNQKKVVANKAVSATCMPMDSSHLPVIMKSVKSKEVQKPMPQTATIPIVPPTPPTGVATGGINSLPQQQQKPPSTNHLAAHHHKPPTANPQPVPSTAFPVSHSSRAVVMTGKREVNVNNIHISHSQPNYPPHLLRSTANQDGNLTPEQLAALASASTGQPTILSAKARQNLFSPTNHLLNNNNINNIPGMKPPTHTPNPFTDPSISTPRSDSPVSRVTNQSPLSVLSTTSSPSTNSDIPDRLPPPYPGRLIAQPSPHHINPPPPPLLPPRVPIKPTTPPLDSDPQFINHHQAIPPHASMPKHVPPSHLPSKFTQQDQSSSSSSPSPSSPVHITGPLPPPPPHPSASTTSSLYAQQQPPLPSSLSSSNVTIGNNNMASSNLPQMESNSNSNNHSLINSNSKSGQPPNSVLSSETEETDTDTSIVSQSPSPAPGKSSNQEKHRCMSPLPERNMEAKERDQLRSDTKVRVYSPQAFKFYMEQHVENVLKSHTQRVNRKLQLEKEMAKANLSDEAACQMRKMLHQKESNYIRLKRAKMDSSMFEKIKTLGVGAFGEVALVRKKDVGNLYAMKTLQKSNVIKRNQVAHVKAERDILAEADNEWVVKLYYSFQDHDNLYFVMDYVPGGDLMGLLIRMEILPENLARFYIAELVLAIESVHRMGFIHRDIKPDNILIDQEGHIKLTDFGLCTGFRWTHNSIYYQKDGTHARQDSMEVSLCQLDDQCRCEILKPLEQRRQREQKRCLAHSLVGTPNYIAPEVLLRQGYTKACDWWSVGVILYEMVIGSPPFYASTPAETQYKVINWKETLCIRHDSNISQATSNFIVRLLQGSDTRLGKEGASQVKDHLFFDGINFEGLRRQPAPYKPTIRSMTDTSNFDPVDPEKLQTSDSDCSKKDHSKHENGKLPEHAFYEFTFRRFFDDGATAALPPQLPPPDSSETNSPVYV